MHESGGGNKTQHLDLRGEVCPYTFVRTKLALEELATGDELDLLFDHRPALVSVPRALREEGHEVLCIEPLSDDRFRILVRKRPPPPVEEGL